MFTLLYVMYRMTVGNQTRAPGGKPQRAKELVYFETLPVKQMRSIRWAGRISMRT